MDFRMIMNEKSGGIEREIYRNIVITNSRREIKCRIFLGLSRTWKIERLLKCEAFLLAEESANNICVWHFIQFSETPRCLCSRSGGARIFWIDVLNKHLNATEPLIRRVYPHHRKHTILSIRALHTFMPWCSHGELEYRKHFVCYADKNSLNCTGSTSHIFYRNNKNLIPFLIY
jgi:hypothetical protein